LEDIEELKECYQNLGIDKVGPKKAKKAKVVDEDAEEAQAEARSVLVDFLTSQLTKPQSFLRDVANSCFKHFCAECVDQQNLERLLGIVATPNQEAGEFMQGDEALDDQDEDMEGDEEIEMEKEELSEDSD